MIKKLRIKFVCTVMSIAMLLVGGILGVVVHFTAQNMQMQSVSMMRSVAGSPFQLGMGGKPADGDSRMPFFTVQLGSRGQLLTAEGGDFDASDREYLQRIAELALDTEGETGVLKDYDLRYLKRVSPRGTSIVFADTEMETATVRSLAYSCIFIFIATSVLFLAVSVLLSRWAIRPVEKAWEQQRQFVADASHELKTPLAVIMANAELLQNGENTENDRRFSANILSTTYQMRSLVENMLEMARVDNGTLKMELAPVDLSQLVSDAVLSFRLLYEEKQLGLESSVQEDVCIRGSEQHLYQVLDVLLDNGLKYSSPDTAVSVTLESHGRSCLLSVASHGETISPEELKNIFKRFYRADKARAMNGSYGLGLSIAEAVVQAHKGKIWAESANGINTFFVQMPTNH